MLHNKQPKPKFELGDKVQCISSKSFAYRVGKVYTVERDTAGILGVRGIDGLFDPLEKMLSQFKKVEE